MSAASTGPPPDAVVVVTGASSGIGRATAALLSGEGRRVVLASRSRSRARATDALEWSGRDRSSCRPTCRSRTRSKRSWTPPRLASVGSTPSCTARRCWPTAGSTTCRPTSSTARWRSPWSARPTSPEPRCGGSQARGSGRLVVVGSLLGKIATPYMSSYVTAKWAVHGLVRCLQIEARATPGVQVSLVSPGGVNTPVYLQAGTYAGRHGMPPPPVVSPERVARTIARRLDQPARDTDVGPANPVTVLGFRLLPGVFDLLVTPLMKVGGLQRTVTGPTPGNVHEPAAAREADPRAVGHGVRRGLRRRARRGAHGCRSEEAVDGAELSRAGGWPRSSATWRPPPTRCGRVLADGWLYANWVVGASRVRRST